MGLQSMQGTPWHVETLRKKTEDERRHKSKCKNYKNGICLYYNYRCPGSSHCDIYVELKTSQNQLESMYNINVDNLYGTFKVLYIENNNIISYEIDKTIERESLLVKLVLCNNKNSTIKLNNNKLKILSKNLYFKKRKIKNVKKT